MQAGDIIAVFSGRRTGERRTKITRTFTREGHIVLDTSACGRLILPENAIVKAEPLR